MFFVLTALPGDIVGNSQSIRSRAFNGGLTTDVKAPDLSTRIAILLKKATTITKSNCNHEIAEQIASGSVQRNIRELESVSD